MRKVVVYMVKKHFTAEKALSLILYLLPVVFLAVTYIMMTATGEDILQGAGAGGGSLYGIKAAFGYNSRLSDMYAYGVMPHFDYLFSFGTDTFFRIIDIAAALGIIYIMTYVILGYRPGLRMGDGLAFGLVFLFVYLSRYCDSMYIAFSHIHNYLFIGLFSALFLLPFALKLLGREMPEGPLFKAAMAVCGFLFGFSSNVTPAAFLVTLICWWAFTRTRPSWELTAAAGVLAACFVMYAVGNGVSHYTSADYQVDYIGLSEIFKSPVWVLKHLRSNFWVMMPCLVPMAVALVFEVYAHKKSASGEAGRVRFSAACLLFTVIHTLAVTQVLVGEILRIMMPAYFTAIVSVGLSAGRVLSMMPWRMLLAGGVAVMLVSAAATVDMARFRAEYNGVVAAALKEIEMTDGERAYISRSALAVRESRLFGFTQFPFLADWTLSQPIYGKYVVLTD